MRGRANCTRNSVLELLEICPRAWLKPLRPIIASMVPDNNFDLRQMVTCVLQSGFEGHNIGNVQALDFQSANQLLERLAQAHSEYAERHPSLRVDDIRAGAKLS